MQETQLLTNKKRFINKATCLLH